MIVGRRECKCRDISVLFREFVDDNASSAVTQKNGVIVRSTSDVLAVRGKCDASDAICVILYCCNVLGFHMRWGSDFGSVSNFQVVDIC